MCGGELEGRVGVRGDAVCEGEPAPAKRIATVKGVTVLPVSAAQVQTEGAVKGDSRRLRGRRITGLGKLYKVS